MNRNIPNYLTIARMVIIPVIILTFYFEEHRITRQIGAALFTIAAITDFVDGYIARRFNIVSNFGKMFDPIADKVLVGCVIIMLVKKERVDAVPCMLILAREFVVGGLREFLAQVKVSVPVSRLAKVKTFIQMFAITVLILGSKGSGYQYMDTVGQLFLWLAAALTLVTGYSYLKASEKYVGFR